MSDPELIEEERGRREGDALLVLGVRLEEVALVGGVAHAGAAVRS